MPVSFSIVSLNKCTLVSDGRVFWGLVAEGGGEEHVLQLRSEHHSAARHQPGFSVQWMLSVLEVCTCAGTHMHPSLTHMCTQAYVHMETCACVHTNTHTVCKRW